VRRAGATRSWLRHTGASCREPTPEQLGRCLQDCVYSGGCGQWERLVKLRWSEGPAPVCGARGPQLKRDPLARHRSRSRGGVCTIDQLRGTLPDVASRTRSASRRGGSPRSRAYSQHVRRLGRMGVPIELQLRDHRLLQPISTRPSLEPVHEFTADRLHGLGLRWRGGSLYAAPVGGRHLLPISPDGLQLEGLPVVYVFHALLTLTSLLRRCFPALMRRVSNGVPLRAPRPRPRPAMRPARSDPGGQCRVESSGTPKGPSRGTHHSAFIPQSLASIAWSARAISSRSILPRACTMYPWWPGMITKG
jgi:hypothetical protein